MVSEPITAKSSGESKERNSTNVKTLTKQLQALTLKSKVQIADFKAKLRVEMREKDDYIRKYLNQTKEVDKLRNLLEHSEQIR